MIEVKNLYKVYSGITTLHDISFSIKKGEIIGFLGPNGAGKTSTMRILTGYLPPSSGTVTIAGFDVVENSLSARKHIGYLPENVPLYNDLQVNEYLNFFAKIAGISSKERKTAIADVMEKTGLTQVAPKLIRSLSRGYKQRVGLAQALLGNPDVLILDEPTVGLDPVQIIEIRELIRDLAKNQTVILSTHILPEVSQICDRVLVINKGRIVADSKTQELLSRQQQRNKVHLTVTDGADKVSSLARSFKSVLKVDKIAQTDKSEQHFVIESTEDIRAALVKKLVQENVDVLESRSETVSLEDVFLDLVTTEKKG